MRPCGLLSSGQGANVTCKYYRSAHDNYMNYMTHNMICDYRDSQESRIEMKFEYILYMRLLEAKMNILLLKEETDVVLDS